MPVTRQLAAFLLLAVHLPLHRLGAQPTTGTLRGVVYDSLGGVPLGGAVVQAAPAGDVQHVRTVTADSLGRFRFDTVAAGRWVVGFDHAVIEMLALEMPFRTVAVSPGDTAFAPLALPGGRALHRVVCAAEPGDSSGALVGVVRHADTDAPVDSVKVFLSWRELVIGRGRLETVVRRVPVPVRAGGSFLLCGVPADAELAMRADAPGLASGDVAVILKPGTLTRQDLTLGAATVAAAPNDSTVLRTAPRPIRGGARLVGTVRDERGRPIANARVLVLGVEGRGATASESGTFAIDSLPSGTWTAEARAVGYQPTRVVAQLAARRVSDARFAMPKSVPQLDRVVILGKRASVGSATLTDALDRSKRYGGTLITPGDIERRQPLWPSDLLRTVPGMQILPNGIGSVIRGRGGCKPAVYLDGMPIQDGADDIDQILPTIDMMAVEVYRGIATPIQFLAGAGSGCGVVAIWTKR